LPDFATSRALTGIAQQHRSRVMDLIVQLGGTYSSSFDANTTHLLCASDKLNESSRDFRAAKSANRFVCHPEWLQACLSSGKRVDERAYPHTYKPGRALSYVVAVDEDVAPPENVTSLGDDEAVDLPLPLKMPTVSPPKPFYVQTTTFKRGLEHSGDREEKVVPDTNHQPAFPPMPADATSDETLLPDLSLIDDVTNEHVIHGETDAHASLSAAPLLSLPKPAAEAGQISNELADHLLQKLWQSGEDNPKLAKVSVTRLRACLLIFFC
jgi:twin BRCT domain